MVNAKSSKTILGPDGLPFKTSTLTKTFAAPTIGGVRNAWQDSIASGLDPSKLAKILKQAAEGDNQAFLALAEEMEERDPHYFSVLGQRKRAVSLIQPIVNSDKDTPEDVKDAIEQLIAQPIFVGLTDDLLDGIAKPHSCVEPLWETIDNRWEPTQYIHRDPRFYKYDKETGQTLLIRDEAYPEGMPIPPYSTIIHSPSLKSGLKVRGGLARVICWCFMLKSFTLQDWAAFLEVFGMPLRVGKYDDNAGPDEKLTLLTAVRDLGSDAAAIIPRGMEIEFIQATGGQGNGVFGTMTDYLDKQISKAVLGQTMTTDSGSSLSQAKVHEDVKIDIKKSDARQIAATINRDLIAPYVAFNFGNNVKPPMIILPVEDPEDIKSFSEALSKLVPMGFKVSQKEVRKRVGTEMPDDDDELLVPPTNTAPAKNSEQAESPDQPERIANKAHLNKDACPDCGQIHLARTNYQQDGDSLLDDALENWQPDMQPLFDQVLDAANDANGFEDFLQRLNTLDPNTDALQQSLAKQAMKARGNGDISDIGNIGDNGDNG